MPRKVLRFVLLGISFLRSPWAMAQSPTIDPSFIYGGIYQPGAVTQALRQPDGKTLLLGMFQRVAGQSAGPLTRLLGNGTQLDPVFQANVAALQGPVDHFVLLPNGKLLLLDDVYYGTSAFSVTLALGGVTRQALLQLNSDGSPDATFDAQLSNFATIQQALPQPDGKILLLGNFRSASGQAGPRLIRLNSDGSLDASFQAPSFVDATNNPASINFMALQPDGKLLVTGNFATVGGQSRQSVARLLPTGTLDTTLLAALPAGVVGISLAVQPDGNLVLTCSGGGPTLPPIRRLLPDGAADSNFQYSGPLLTFTAAQYLPPVIQPDGRIVVATRSTLYNSTPTGRVLRFTANGSLDSSFDNFQAATGKPTSTLAALNNYPGSLQLLPNGQFLITTGAGTADLFRYAPLATSVPVGVAMLNSDGSRDATFAPLVQDYGYVYDFAIQPDGKLVVGGLFSEINGVAVRNLARLLPNGLVDASFTAGTDDGVYALATQPDGKIVVGGNFDFLNGSARPALGRVLPTGTNDAAFVPPITAGTVSLSTSVRHLALRPTGEIIADGGFSLQRAGAVFYAALAQFQAASGQEDSSFQPALPNGTSIRNTLLLANGKLLMVGSMPVNGSLSTPIWRLLPNGTLDAGFTMPSAIIGGIGTAVAADGAGRLYVGGYVDNLGAVGNRNMGRLLADGQPDPSFQAALQGSSAAPLTIAVQPNGRVLLGGELPAGGANRQGTARLLPTGAPDPSYLPDNGPVGAGIRNGVVYCLRLQADGAILAAGSFPQVSSLPINGLVRLLDSNVLAVRPSQTAATLAAWPVPAHEVLHLALDATARPLRVALLDALGRTVRTQAVTQPEVSFATAGLPPGVYLLRVDYAQGGPVTRRVVLE